MTDIQVTLHTRRGDTLETGPDVLSIARRIFGDDVTATPEHSDAFQPEYRFWTVTVANEYGSRDVLGRIHAPAEEDPPPNRGGRPRVDATPLTIRPRPDMLAALDAIREADESRPQAIDRLLRTHPSLRRHLTATRRKP